MNVKELIKELKKIKNKNKEIYIFDGDDINEIILIDELDDRIDLNV